MNVIDRMRLDGKAAFVTGSARNLGRAYAEALASAGAKVCIADIRAGQAEETAGQIAEKYGAETMFCPVDVTDPASVKTMVEAVAARFGALDIAVANAGIFIESRAEDTTPEIWNRILSVNLTGTWYTCQAAGRYMIEHGIHGSLVVTASISGHQASKAPGCAYSASKGGVIAIVRDLATEWGKYGIRINAVSPGNMNTVMLSEDWRKRFQKACEDETVLGRLGEPEELQGALLYLAGGASSYTTGTEIVVDGGYIIQ